MCLAIPGKVLKVSGKTAEIDFAGKVGKALSKYIKVSAGDYVLTDGKHITEKISEDEALEIMSALGLK